MVFFSWVSYCKYVRQAAPAKTWSASVQFNLLDCVLQIIGRECVTFHHHLFEKVQKCKNVLGLANFIGGCLKSEGRRLWLCFLLSLSQCLLKGLVWRAGGRNISSKVILGWIHKHDFEFETISSYTWQTRKFGTLATRLRNNFSLVESARYKNTRRNYWF